MEMEDGWDERCKERWWLRGRVGWVRDTMGLGGDGEQ